MPSKSGKEDYISVLAVVRLFEWNFEEWLKALITSDARNLLRICHETKLISEEFYNKLRDGYSDESKTKSILQKMKEATREQVMALLDLIEEHGTGVQLHQLKAVRQTLHTKVRTNHGLPQVNTSQCKSTIARMKEEQKQEDFLAMKVAVKVLFKDISLHTTTDLQNMRKQCEEAEKLREENDQLKNKVIMLKKANASFQTYMQQFSSTIAELKQQIESQSEKMKEKDDELKEQREQTERVQQENLQLWEELQEKTKELQKASLEIDTLHQKMTEMEQKAAKEKSDQDRYNQEMESRLQRLEMQSQKTSNRLACNPKATQLELFGHSLPMGASIPAPRLQDPLPPIPQEQ